MTVKHFVAAAFVLAWASMLGACSPFSSSIADMWPHWAGGEPAGLPPRPGEPGYAQFIAHGQPSQNPAAAPAAAQPAPVGTTATIAEQKTPAADQKAPAFAEPQLQEKNAAVPLPEAVEGPANNSAVVQGGLY